MRKEILEKGTNRDRLFLQRKIWVDNTATYGQALFNRKGTHWLKQIHAYARVSRHLKF